jgi:hypothetical protein
VTGTTGATGPASANNALTLTAGPTVQLGGTLIQDTSVTFGGPLNNFALSFGNTVGPGVQANLKLNNTSAIVNNNANQTANAQFGGSVSNPLRVITANYTIANDDYTVLCNNATATAVVTISPPAANVSNKGRVYVIKRINGDVTGTTNDNCQVANVDGAATVALVAPNSGLFATQRSAVIIQSDGTQWWIIGGAP